MSHHHNRNKSQESQPFSAESRPSVVEADARDRQATIDRIRLRAYEISQARKGGPGDALTDWTQAEQELRAGRDATR